MQAPDRFRLSPTSCGNVRLSRLGASARVPAPCPTMQPSSNAIASSSPPPEAAPGPTPPQQHKSTLWLHRTDLFLRVIIRLYIGIVLVFLPWTHLWDYNRFFLYYAPIAHFTQSGAVRGLVSGLGLLNLWIALSEAIRYKD